MQPHYYAYMIILSLSNFFIIEISYRDVSLCFNKWPTFHAYKMSKACHVSCWRSDIMKRNYNNFRKEKVQTWYQSLTGLIFCQHLLPPRDIGKSFGEAIVTEPLQKLYGWWNNLNMQYLNYVIVSQLHLTYLFIMIDARKISDYTCNKHLPVFPNFNSIWKVEPKYLTLKRRVSFSPLIESTTQIFKLIEMQLLSLAHCTSSSLSGIWELNFQSAKKKISKQKNGNYEKLLITYVYAWYKN